MITLLMILIILLLVMVGAAVITIIAGGAAFVLTFSDVILFGIIVWFIVRYFSKLK